MAKKRVHEIAKELKSHGIELDNKDVVAELLSLGYDVKSHSSSLEDDQANAAILKIVEQKKPKAPPPVAAAGFRVRRKVIGPGIQRRGGAPRVVPELALALEPGRAREPEPIQGPLEVLPPSA